MKQLIYITLFFGFSSTLIAQHESQSTQLYTNPYMHNPAASGMMSLTDVNLGFRQQWAGIEGAPRTFFASAHSQINIGKKGGQVLQEFRESGTFFATPEVTTGGVKHVVGGKLFTDQIGPFNKTS